MRVSASIEVLGDNYDEIIQSATEQIARFLNIDEDEIETKVDVEIDIKDQGEGAAKGKRYAATAHLRMKR